MIATLKKTTETTPTLQSDNVPVDLSLSNLNPAYRFDNYVTGNANRIPFGAAQNVAEFPGGDYNPLFIYGPSGLGKTHLMHAIGNAIKENHPHMKVMSITSENFMNIFVETLQRNQGKLFRNTFRNIDVLMIDDIQFLESRESTKTELFNTFNELLNNNKQIVLTSDTMPNDMEQFEDRLRSRFQAGYIATMENPDLETRIAIFRSLLEREYKRIALFVSIMIQSTMWRCNLAKTSAYCKVLSPSSSVQRLSINVSNLSTLNILNKRLSGPRSYRRGEYG